MNSMIENSMIDLIIAMVVSMVVIAGLGLPLVYIPATAKAELNCARKGYPKALVMYNLEAYCVTIAGATVKMEELK